MTEVRVQYTFLSSHESNFDIPKLPWVSRTQAVLAKGRCCEYLRARGVEYKSHYLSQAFIIIHASAKHRTATELIMSGRQHTCELHIKIV